MIKYSYITGQQDNQQLSDYESNLFQLPGFSVIALFPKHEDNDASEELIIVYYSESQKIIKIGSSSQESAD